MDRLRSKLAQEKEKLLFRLGLRKVNRNRWQAWSEDVIRDFLRTDTEGVDCISRRKIREILLEFPGATLLDAACGPAVELEGYKKYDINVDYTGMDFTQKMVDHARKTFLDAKFELGDITNINKGNCSFDIVLARHIFEHLPHYRKAMEECFRVAKRAVIVNFFIELNNTSSDIITTRGKDVYNNCYSRKLFEDFLAGVLRVRSFENFRNLGPSNFSENEIYLIRK